MSKTDGFFLFFFAFLSNPLRRSGLRVTKTEGKVRFLHARICRMKRFASYGFSLKQVSKKSENCQKLREKCDFCMPKAATLCGNPHLHISDPHTSDRHILYILASASHLRIFISQIFISDLYIFTFTFKSSYFETTSCLHIFGSSSCSRTVLSYHLQDFIMQLLLHFYNLIYVRLQNFISPLSGQPSSSENLQFARKSFFRQNWIFFAQVEVLVFHQFGFFSFPSFFVDDET